MTGWSRLRDQPGLRIPLTQDDRWIAAWQTTIAALGRDSIHGEGFLLDQSTALALSGRGPDGTHGEPHSRK